MDSHVFKKIIHASEYAILVRGHAVFALEHGGIGQPLVLSDPFGKSEGAPADIVVRRRAYFMVLPAKTSLHNKHRLG